MFRRTLTTVPHLLLLGVSLATSACGSDVVAPPTDAGTGGGAGSGGSAAQSTSATSSAGAGDTLGAACDLEGSLRCDDAGDGTFLLCEGGRYVPLGACAAGEPCQDVQGADSVACGDTFLGVAGTPCASAATAVCDLAREVVLGCDDGTWDVFRRCAPVACATVTPGAGRTCSGTACENCGYTLGDRCNFAPGAVNCSTDGGAVVACSEGRVTLFEDCAASGLTCTLEGDVIECL